MKHRAVSHTLLLFIIVPMYLGGICAAKLPDAPPARSRHEIEQVLARARKLQPPARLKRLNIVLVADKKDHRPCEHDYPLWQKRWRVLLSGSESGPVNLYGSPQDSPRPQSRTGSTTVTTAHGWPSNEQLVSADVVVVFCYIKWDKQKLNQLREHIDRGGGFVLVHSATWTKPQPAEDVAELTGCGGFTRYRHGPVELNIVDSSHPICLGLPEEIRFVDESYWPPTARPANAKMHVLATSNEKTSTDSSQAEPQPMFWTYELSKGRVFSCVLGHYTWTFDDPYFRLLLMRGIAWSAGRWPYRFDTLAIRGIRLAK